MAPRAMPAITALLLMTASARAQEDTPSLYLIDGNPVPLACLSTLGNFDSSRTDPIDLGKCGTGLPPDTASNGPNGFHDTTDSGYFDYNYLGSIRGLDILFIDNGGGGSGQFSQLVGLKREGDMLQLAQTFAYGDRCNMSPLNAKLRDGSLSYDLTTTPNELITLLGKEAALKDDGDLEDSAASCVALTHIRDEKIVGVTLTEKDLQDQAGWTEQFRYQSCFNAFYRKSVAAGQVDLTREELSAFTKGFLNACVTKAK
jgi:hypothetical protein